MHRLPCKSKKDVEHGAVAHEEVLETELKGIKAGQLEEARRGAPGAQRHALRPLHE